MKYKKIKRTYLYLRDVHIWASTCEYLLYKTCKKLFINRIYNIRVHIIYLTKQMES